jgi:anti-sigma-K factor RskA
LDEKKMDGEPGLMSEEHVFDLLAGYALGILDEEELSLVTEHLQHCDVCQREVAAYAETVGHLARTTAQLIPAPELKAKVLQNVNQAAEHRQSRFPNSSSEKISLREILRNLFRQPVGLAFGVLTLLVVLLLGVTNILLRQQVNELHAQVPRGYMQIVRLEGTDLAPETSGYVMVFRDQNYGSLAVTHAPLLTEDQQYQIWLIRDGVRTSGGVFSVNEDGYGNLMVSAEQPLDSFDAFGITIEPLGGSPQPTGGKVLGGEL